MEARTSRTAAAGTALVTQKNSLEGPVCTDWQEGKERYETET